MKFSTIRMILFGCAILCGASNVSAMEVVGCNDELEYNEKITKLEQQVYQMITYSSARDWKCALQNFIAQQVQLLKPTASEYYAHATAARMLQGICDKYIYQLHTELDELAAQGKVVRAQQNNSNK